MNIKPLMLSALVSLSMTYSVTAISSDTPPVMDAALSEVTVSWEDSPDIVGALYGNDNKEIGFVILKQGTEGVLIRIQVKGLTPGKHGMHFHRVGDCSDHKHFKKAGAHVDPHGKPHGFLNPNGPHEGNLPNLIVHADGTADVELYSQMVSLKDGESALLDEDGSTLIIHTNTDDHTSQPIGGAGARVACAVVR